MKWLPGNLHLHVLRELVRATAALEQWRPNSGVLYVDVRKRWERAWQQAKRYA